MACLHRQDAAVAAQGTQALFIAFITLLVTFIGEPLTARLLREAWPEAFPATRGGISMADRVEIRRLPTGVPGLDEILGGGLPEFSFNLIAGAPGAGKTTLAQQIMFALRQPERPALYFTVLGEPPLKMLRYQQQFSFFDAAKVNESIRFVNLEPGRRSTARWTKLLGAHRAARSRRRVPGSCSSIRFAPSQRRRGRRPGSSTCRTSCSSCLHLTSWEATTFLIGEYHEPPRPRQPGLHRGRRPALAVRRASTATRWFARCRS